MTPSGICGPEPQMIPSGMRIASEKPATAEPGSIGQAKPRRPWGGATVRLAIGFGLLLLAPRAVSAAEFRPGPALPGADLFANGAPRQIHIEIAPGGVASLRQNPREFVRATVREDSATYEDVAVHLKGSIGSFREVDDKPALTLDFNRFDAR